MKIKKPLIKLVVILAISGIIATIVVFWVPNIKDYKKFPYFVIHNASPAYHFKYSIVPNLFNKAKYRYKKKLLVSDFEKFLVSTGTTAFIVIRNDTIIYEKYFNGYRRNSINKSFSIAKSFISALVGIAIDHGYIKSIDEPVIDYIPELRGKGFNLITIKNLLTMTSGIKHSKFDEFKSYITADLKKNILNAEIETEPGKYYHYKNYDPQLLGLILSRATKEKVATFLQEKLWKPLGMEYPASWSVDSKRGRFEKIESGINARAIDFAKFGRLFLNNGNWNGHQLISEKWVKESTENESTNIGAYYNRYHKGLFNKNKYYKYLWCGFLRGKTSYDFYAEGHLGQYLYICPSKNLVFVRLGKETGKVDSWPDVLKDLSDKIQ